MLKTQPGAQQTPRPLSDISETVVVRAEEQALCCVRVTTGAGLLSQRLGWDSTGLKPLPYPCFSVHLTNVYWACSWGALSSYDINLELWGPCRPGKANLRIK